MPEFNLDTALNATPTYKCAVCGAPLIYGGWKNYYEYYELNPETGAAGDAQCGRDHSEGDEVVCSLRQGHHIGWTDEQHEEFHENWG